MRTFSTGVSAGSASASVTLRDYQVALINQTREAFRSGYHRPLVVLPAGGGKTVCFADMAYKHVSADSERRVWFLVHRRELVAQARETFSEWGLSDSHITVGMVQTISRRLGTHTERPTLIIIDEAHHSVSATWRKIIEYYPDVPVVGLTATPQRLSGEGLGEIFDTLIEGVSAEWLTERGYLAPYDYYAPRTVDLHTVSIRGSDYNPDEVTEVLLKSHIYSDINKHLDLTRKTIIYTPSIRYSMSLAEHNPDIVHFDAQTPTAERDRIIRDFRAGIIRAISNVDLVGEGLNIPDCDTVILVRPTQSLSLYIQQSMRCLRPMQGKRAQIYDLVGNCYRHGLPTEPRVWSLSGRVRCRVPSGEPDLVVRRCQHCLLVYSGTASICPYCNRDNGKTRAEIRADEQAELERVEAVVRVERKREQGMAKSYEELVQLGIRRGYSAPHAWAKNIMKSRRKKI